MNIGDRLANLRREYQRKWPRAHPWIITSLFALFTAVLLIVPGVLLEIIPITGDKIKVTILVIIIAALLITLGYLPVYRSIWPIEFPKKSCIYIFIPANEKGSWGDAFLQYAGFWAGNDESNKKIKLEFRDSSKGTFLDEIDQCITDTPENNPVWIVITMSHKGYEARKHLDKILKRDPHLKERLTVLFTVASSRFETSDRKNMFRIFVDGEAEGVAISEYIRLNMPGSKSNPTPILCYRVNGQYGTDALNRLEGCLSKQYKVIPCYEDGLNEIDITQFKIVVAISYDQGLRKLFDFLDENNFEGQVLGTTTLSVPSWQKQWNYDSSKIAVMYTAVSGFEEDETFVKKLKPLNYSRIIEIDQAQNDPIFMRTTIDIIHDDSRRYNAGKGIENNYISAFCAVCIHLLALAIDKDIPTLHALLDDPEMDEERGKLTIIRDLDFGVTGDAHVSVFMRKAEEA